MVSSQKKDGLAAWSTLSRSRRCIQRLMNGLVMLPSRTTPLIISWRTAMAISKHLCSSELNKVVVSIRSEFTSESLVLIQVRGVGAWFRTGNIQRVLEILREFSCLNRVWSFHCALASMALIASCRGISKRLLRSSHQRNLMQSYRRAWLSSSASPSHRTEPCVRRGAPATGLHHPGSPSRRRSRSRRQRRKGRCKQRRRNHCFRELPNKLTNS